MLHPILTDIDDYCQMAMSNGVGRTFFSDPFSVENVLMQNKFVAGLYLDIGAYVFYLC